MSISSISEKFTMETATNLAERIHNIIASSDNGTKVKKILDRIDPRYKKLVVNYRFEENFQNIHFCDINIKHDC